MGFDTFTPTERAEAGTPAAHLSVFNNQHADRAAERSMYWSDAQVVPSYASIGLLINFYSGSFEYYGRLSNQSSRESATTPNNKQIGY